MRLLVVLFAATLLLSVVGAAPPVTQVTTETSELQIAYPKTPAFPLNSNFSLHFHVYNGTGYILDNTTVDCFIHLYGLENSHLTRARMVYDDNVIGGDFEYKNFDWTNETGVYAYITWCNGTQGAGFVSSSFEVTVDGTDTDAAGGALLAAIIMIPLVLGVLLVWGSSALGAEHNVLKIFLYLLSFPLVLFAFHLGVVSVAKVYHFPELTDAVAGGVYWIGLSFTVLVLYYLIYIFVQLVRVAANKRKQRLEY